MANKIDRDSFLKKYRISSADFKRTKLKWPELEAIYRDHSSREQELLAAANYVRDRLQQISAVHSLKVRIKDPEHVIEKIIRKRLERPSRKMTTNTYRKHITDLIGVRALHLFKADWREIHDVITLTWELNEAPVANVRRGDPDQAFRDAGCKVKQHPAGYRSVHYMVRHQPARSTELVEIQVRTIFEEGWSEIDHRIRYPHNTDDEVLSQFLAIFNGLAGSADHMGSYINFLASEMEGLRRAQSGQGAQKSQLRAEIKHLKSAIAKLQIDVRDRERLNERLRAVTASSEAMPVVRINDHSNPRIGFYGGDILRSAGDSALASALSSASKSIAEAAGRTLSSSEINRLFGDLSSRTKR